MLRELHISNLAVIFDAKIDFVGGLNCFTGATGAGKSLVIGALEVLLGLRNPVEMLRPGANEGRISGLFEVRSKETLSQITHLSDTDIAEDAGELLLTRKIYASGRSSVSLNGQPITLGMLKQISEHLVDVHGQHDHQYLLKPGNQIEVIDQFGGLEPLRQQYYAVYEQLQSARRRLQEITTNGALHRQQLDLYRFQARELDAGELDAAEYVELQARSAVLVNLEKLKKEAGAVHSSLYEVDASVLERLKMMVAVLAELSSLDTSLKPIAGAVRDATIALEESAFDLSRYLDKLEIEPGELEEVNDRLNTINRVLNKYGDTVEVALEYKAEVDQKIAELERLTDDSATLKRQLEPLQRELKRLGAQLSEERSKVAARLSPGIEKELHQLGMEKAIFSISVERAAVGTDGLPATPSGFDQIEFIAQTNPGQSPQPLRKIASGGEMSRIMLALKGILAQSDRVSVLVFDEIDANVGGRLGSIIGNKLRRLAEHHQVLCITHLPQIAAYADRHFTVKKQVVAGKTESSVRVMQGPERLEELAEMIGGARVTEVTRAQAGELLETAQAEFNSAKVTINTAAVRKKKGSALRAK